MLVFRYGARGWALAAITAAFFAAGPRLRGQGTLDLSGKVVMEDGSPPPKAVAIQRVCGGRNPVRVGGTNTQGEVRWSEAMFMVSTGECIWRAVLAGYESDVLDMDTLEKSSRLPDIVLHGESSVVPSEAGPQWMRAYKAMQDKKWADAEKELRGILAKFPKSGPVLAELGFTLAHEQRLTEARQAYESAIRQAPRYLRSYGPLIQLQIDAGDLEAAEKTAVAGTAADRQGTAPDLYLDLAEVRVQMHAEGAEAAVRKAMALDKNHTLPRAEYVLGLILAEGDDYASAILHLKKYLELVPRAPEAAAVRSRIKSLEASAAEAVSGGGSVSRGGAADRSAEGSTEVTVPGGLQALAALARLKGTPSPATFFLEYCRAIAAENEPGARAEDPGFAEEIEAYLAAAVELSQMAENRAGRITLVPDALVPGTKTAGVLKLFGWKDSRGGAGDWIEPSDLASDSSRQRLPAALGVDEIEAAKSLASGAPFHFDVHSAQAPLLEARGWRALAGGLPPGGFAELFIRNPRFAVAYVGLASMGPGAASAAVSGVGLRVLVNRYADAIQLYGESFAVADGRVKTPGGSEADAAWERLAGASPSDPKAFFRALLAKDQGKLAAFYFGLARGDAAHQRFFAQDAACAEQFYKWYRDSDDLRSRFNPQYVAWRQTLFRELPLDNAGAVRYPGGRAAWNTSPGADRDILTGLTALESLVPVANFEQKRKAPLDEASVRLLAAHYSSWRPLFPYFEKLPGLARAEFEALAAFEASVSARPRDAQNVVVGEWHSLVKLIELGSHAGSLNAAAGAQAFRRVCEALSAPDYSAQSLAALREMTNGAADPDEAIPAGLLRLRGARRASFDRLREMQRTPDLKTLTGADGERVLAALAGQVYAALLDPDILLIAEDPLLAARHQYLGDARGPAIFSASGLQNFHQANTSHFSGGFMDFEEVAGKLARSKPPAAQASPAAPSPAEATVSPVALIGPDGAAGRPEAVFRISARLVEIYATVTDDRGRYVDDLGRADFMVLDNGEPAQVTAFENRTAGVSVALVLDTTGSMYAALPALKSSAFKLIDALRPVDTVAVYAFNESVSELQPFTKNKDLAKRAVLRTLAQGNTGLHDALVRVTRDLSSRPGKKAIVVFTDGADNASLLTSDAVIRRAKTEDVAVYTVAHGDALNSRELTAQLDTVAKATGGLSFAIKDPTEIRGVFEHISQDLLHGYLLAFQPAADDIHEWRSLQVVLQGPQPRKVRAREGYFSEE